MLSLSFLISTSIFFATPSFAAATTTGTKLLLPLYQYPEGQTWDPVYAAIEAHPEVVFQVILNADSGPGGPAPDDNFAAGAAKLNAYANVETLGYVHCAYGAAAQDDVHQNVTDWAAWGASHAGAGVGGIFFDETPNTQGGGSGNGDVAFMQAVVGAAKTTFAAAGGAGGAFTSMLNPGSAVEHAEFWDLASYIVVYEAAAAQYTAAVLTTNIPAGRAGQASILIYDFASRAGGSEALAAEWLAGMRAAGVGSAHILDYDYIQATTADAPASIASVAVALAVVPAVVVVADAGGAQQQPETETETETETASRAATTEKGTAPSATSLVTSVTPAPTGGSLLSETSVSYEPTPAVASASSTAVGTASVATPTGDADDADDEEEEEEEDDSDEEDDEDDEDYYHGYRHRHWRQRIHVVHV